MKTIFSPLTILVVLNITLILILSQAKANSTDNINSPAKRLIDVEQLELIAGEDVRHGAYGTLYIFFHADGSCACIDDWSNWVKVYNELSEDIAVIGIFNGKDLEEFTSFSRSMNLPFPIYSDNKRAVSEPLMVTPGQIVKAFVDANGHLVFMDSNETSKKNQQFFLQRLKEHVDTLNG